MVAGVCLVARQGCGIIKTMYKLNCIKCSTQYESEDEDPYLCLPCNELRLKIAKEIDAKFALQGKIPQGKSDLQLYDEIKRRNGVVKMGLDGNMR